MKLVGLNESSDIHTGLDKKARREVAKLLSSLLADTYSLQLKTLFYHWNVTGEHFSSLHALFQEQYAALPAAVDEIAERIRSLGFMAPGTYREFATLSTIAEDKAVPSDWRKMIQNLLTAHETIARNIGEYIPVAQDGGDEVTTDLLIGRKQYHEKTAWMLRSLIGK